MAQTPPTAMWASERSIGDDRCAGERRRVNAGVSRIDVEYAAPPLNRLEPALSPFLAFSGFFAVEPATDGARHPLRSVAI